MKLSTFLLLLTIVPGAALAEEINAENLVELNASPAGPNPLSGSGLREVRQSGLSEKKFGANMVEDLRNRIFAVLQARFTVDSGSSNNERLQSKNEREAQADEKRAVSLIALTETLKYTRERIPIIDTLANAMTFEISNRKQEERANEEPAGKSMSGKGFPVQASLYVKTGLRLPVERGKAVLRSETEAGFGKWSSAFNVNLDGQYDHSVRVTYALARDLHVQNQWTAAHTADPAAVAKAPTRSTFDLVQLIYNF